MSSKLSLPSVVKESIENLVGRVTHAEPLSGGCSFPTYVIQCNKESFFLKFSTENTDVFIKEAHGLNELSTQKKITPEVFLANNNCLLLEYIPPLRPTLQFWQNLAESLAQLHQVKKESYGFYEDNFIGSSRQLNKTNEDDIDWPKFFYSYRISPQLSWLEEKQSMNLDQETKIQLQNQIERELSNTSSYPSIVHGDLWNGNIHCGSNQSAYLLDPAIYYGDREVDLAMTHLFGGFSQTFYQTYNEILPLEKGHEKRRKIYNLYHLLNHFLLFGSSYKESVFSSIEQILHF